MEIVIDFPGDNRVDAHVGPYTVKTDQPSSTGGEGSAPTPFAIFLASIGACAGIYVLSFCRQRGIPTQGLRLIHNRQVDPATGLVSKIMLDIQLPSGFPEKYRAAVVRAAEQCAVKKHLEQPPTFEIRTRITEPSAR